MSSYTIKITPDDSHGASMTLRIEVRAAAAQIKEVTIRPGEDGGLSARQIPAIDFELLMRAVTPATSLPAIGVPNGAPATKATPAEASAAPPVLTAAPEVSVPSARAAVAPRSRGGRAKSTVATAAAVTATTAGKAATKTSASKASASKLTAAKGTATNRAVPKSAVSKAPVSKAPANNAAASTGVPGKAAGRKAAARRAYRKMPDDVVAVFREAGGVTAMAKHYGVPRHTAQGWVSRLRVRHLLPAGR